MGQWLLCCPDPAGNRGETITGMLMGKERISTRQKNISRLLREKKELHAEKIKVVRKIKPDKASRQ